MSDAGFIVYLIISMVIITLMFIHWLDCRDKFHKARRREMELWEQMNIKYVGIDPGFNPPNNVGDDDKKKGGSNDPRDNDGWVNCARPDAIYVDEMQGEKGTANQGRGEDEVDLYAPRDNDANVQNPHGDRPKDL